MEQDVLLDGDTKLYTPASLSLLAVELAVFTTISVFIFHQCKLGFQKLLHYSRHSRTHLLLSGDFHRPYLFLLLLLGTICRCLFLGLEIYAYERHVHQFSVKAQDHPISPDSTTGRIVSGDGAFPEPGVSVSQQQRAVENGFSSLPVVTSGPFANVSANEPPLPSYSTDTSGSPLVASSSLPPAGAAARPACLFCGGQDYGPTRSEVDRSANSTDDYRQNDRFLPAGKRSLTESAQLDASVWFHIFFRCLPSLFLLSSYTIVIVFWVEIDCACRRAAPSVVARPAVCAGVFSIYLVCGVLGWVTLLHHRYSQFRRYAMFIIGLLYVCVSVAWLLYGLKVFLHLKTRPPFHPPDLVATSQASSDEAAQCAERDREATALWQSLSSPFSEDSGAEETADFVASVEQNVRSSWFPIAFFKCTSSAQPQTCTAANVFFPPATSPAFPPFRPSLIADNDVNPTLLTRHRHRLRPLVSLHWRVFLLAVLCGCLFAFRGVYNLLVIIHEIRKYYYFSHWMNRIEWDAAMYLSTEAVPSILILLVFWQSRQRQCWRLRRHRLVVRDTSQDGARSSLHNHQHHYHHHAPQSCSSSHTALQTPSGSRHDYAVDCGDHLCDFGEKDLLAPPQRQMLSATDRENHLSDAAYHQCSSPCHGDHGNASVCLASASQKRGTTFAKSLQSALQSRSLQNQTGREGGRSGGGVINAKPPSSAMRGDGEGDYDNYDMCCRRLPLLFRSPDPPLDPTTPANFFLSALSPTASSSSCPSSLPRSAANKPSSLLLQSSFLSPLLHNGVAA